MEGELFDGSPASVYTLFEHHGRPAALALLTWNERAQLGASGGNGGTEAGLAFVQQMPGHHDEPELRALLRSDLGGGLAIVCPRWQVGDTYRFTFAAHPGN